MIDLHCHLLPGIDDGPAALADSMALARAAVAGGVRMIVATPHVSWDYRNDARLIADGVAEVRGCLHESGIPLEVRAGAEIAITRVGDLGEDELDALTLGGGPWLLVEPPFAVSVTGWDTLLLALAQRGRRIVIAHPERCPAFQRDPRALAHLVEAGMLCSITAGSLAGRFGRDVRRTAMQFMRDGLAHNVASDAHDVLRRPPGLAQEMRESGLESLLEWATEAVPAALIEGGTVPERPPSAARGRRAPWWRRVPAAERVRRA